MDWNNDGRTDGKDYALYKSTIESENDSSGYGTSSKGLGATGWVITIGIICLILKIIGSF